MSLGERIKEQRKKMNLSQEELGKRLGISKGAVSNVETGKERLTTDRVERYARALNVTVTDLIGSAESPGDVFLEYIRSLGCDFAWEDPEHKPLVYWGEAPFAAEYDSYSSLKEKIDGYAITAIKSMIIDLQSFDELIRQQREKISTASEAGR